MNLKKLETAVAEAKRFLVKAQAAKKRIQKEGKYAEYTPTKETAAARRASMDLTRALAELRKPN